NPVARVEPKIAPGFHGFIRHSEIPGSKYKRLRCAQHELARHTIRHFIVEFVDNLCLESRPGPAHKTRLLIYQFIPDSEIGFGRAITINQPDPEPLFENLVKLRWNAWRECNSSLVRT